MRALKGESCVVDDMELHRPERTVALQVWGTPVVHATDGVQYAIAAFTDITKRKSAERALLEKERQAQERALRDDLTGLHNRRGLLHVAETLFELGIRAERSLSVVYIDLDDVKAINDKHGHQQGDRALQDVAAILEGNLRESDFIARLGGDEFCILLSGGSEAQDRVAIERIQQAVEHHNSTQSRPYSLGLSIGLARSDPKSPGSVDDLIRAADVGMYRHKASKLGRS